MKSYSHTFYALLSAAVLLFAFQRCSDDTPTEPPPGAGPDTLLHITLIETGYVSVLLKLHSPSGVDEMEYALEREGEIVLEGSFFGADTVVVDRGLVSSHDYAYRLYRVVDAKYVDTSAIVIAHTTDHSQQDTTSHDVTWEILTFGREAIDASIFRDIYALNDDDIWVVGVIRTDDYMHLDSLGREIQAYNAVHWDGKEWTYHRLNADSLYGQNAFTHLYAMYLFGHNYVLGVDDGGELNWWDGEKYWKQRTPSGTRRGTIARVFAYSDNHYFLAGSNGSLTEYRDGTFSLIETGTTGRFVDIHGNKDGYIYVGGWDLQQGIGNFLRIRDGEVIDVRKSFLEFADAIYCSDDTVYAYGGGGVMIQSIKDTSHYRLVRTKSFADHIGWIKAMRGIGDNNIFAAGLFGTILHYNGKSWKRLSEWDETNRTTLSSIAMTERHVYIAGVNLLTGQAVIYKGTFR